MEGWRGGAHTAAFRASGYLLIFDPDTIEPFLLMADGEIPMGVLPANITEAQQERMVAWLICEMAIRRLGRREYLQRLMAYGRIAALVTATWLLCDVDRDGVPDILHWLRIVMH